MPGSGRCHDDPLVSVGFGRTQSSAVLTFEEHRDPACTDHPHCVCGAQLNDDGSDVLVCPDPECGTNVLIGSVDRERAEVAR